MCNHMLCLVTDRSTGGTAGTCARLWVTVVTAVGWCVLACVADVRTESKQGVRPVLMFTNRCVNRIFFSHTKEQTPILDFVLWCTKKRSVHENRVSTGNEKKLATPASMTVILVGKKLTALCNGRHNGNVVPCCDVGSA